MSSKRNVYNCPTCGQQCVERKVAITKGLMDTLLGIYQQVGLEVFARKDLDFSQSGYCTFTSAKYLGLLRAEAPGVRNGKWKLTRKFLRFIIGEVPIWKEVWVFDDKIREAKGELFFHEIEVTEDSPYHVDVEWVRRNMREALDTLPPPESQLDLEGEDFLA